MTEPKWIRPTSTKTTYEKQLKKVVDDVKNDFTESTFKIGNRTFVVMMTDDFDTIKTSPINENDQFLFEIVKNQYTGDLNFTPTQVTLDYFDDEADGRLFNAIAPVGDKKDNLFCVKRIGPDGKPVYNLAKYDTVHKKMKPSTFVSTQPINFEEGQTVCSIYSRDGKVFGVNTNGERTPAPNIVIDGKDNK